MKLLHATAVGLGCAILTAFGVAGTTQADGKTAPPAHSGRQASQALAGENNGMPMPKALSRAEVPASLSKLLGRHEVLLAHKSLDVTGDGSADHVLIVRRPVQDGPPEYDENPCELRILHGGADEWQLAGRSSKAVDCTYKEFARKRADKPDDLNDLLVLRPLEVTVHNEKEMGGGDSYSFSYSTERASWHLSGISTTHSRSGADSRGVSVVQRSASYPASIDWVPIEQFDPRSEKLLAVLRASSQEVP